MPLLPEPGEGLTIVSDGARTYIVVEVERDQVIPVAQYLARRQAGPERAAASVELRDALVNAARLHVLPERIQRAAG